MPTSWLSELNERPIIAAVRDEATLQAALDSPVAVIFLLSGTLHTIERLVRRVEGERRAVFVHLDLMEGLARDQHGLRWLAERARPTGIISTRSSVLASARSLGLATVQRLFLLDSQSVHTGLEMARHVNPDVIEVLPGILPQVIKELSGRIDKPVIAGGMITTTEQCRGALLAGARGVSSSNQELWQTHPNLCRTKEDS